MKIGLFFGTFNPVHKGHIAVAEYMAKQTDLDEVWLVISPQNPLKADEELVPDDIRVQMVEAAIIGKNKLCICNEELQLPKPSYTIYTLKHLQEKYVRHTFILIIGRDNLSIFPKWKDYETILSEHQIYVYPRASIDIVPQQTPLVNHSSVKLVDAPLIIVSSTQIRDNILQGKKVDQLLISEVNGLIKKLGLYQ